MSSDMIFSIIVLASTVAVLVYFWRFKIKMEAYGDRHVTRIFEDGLTSYHNNHHLPFRGKMTEMESDIKTLFNEATEMRSRIERLEQEPRFLKDAAPRKRGRARGEIIAYLQAKKSCSTADIVKEFGFTKPTVLKVADKLVNSGMIEKSYVKGRLVLTLKKEEGSHE